MEFLIGMFLIVGVLLVLFGIEIPYLGSIGALCFIIVIGLIVAMYEDSYVPKSRAVDAGWRNL